MSLSFIDRAGPHERHLQRRSDNPLFPPTRRHVSQADLDAARQRDRQFAERFQATFTDLVQRAMHLKPNEESETLLELKAEMDKAYTEAAALGGDQQQAMDALDKLIALIMSAVRHGAQGDALAQQELDDEEQARRTHHQLLRFPLIADLMLPDSPLVEADLLPALLGSDAEALDAALWLFEADQLGRLAAEGDALLTQLAAKGIDITAATARLEQLHAQSVNHALDPPSS